MHLEFEIIQFSKSVMKIFILFVLFATSQAAVLVTPDFYGAGISAQFRNQDNLGNYAFGYNEGHRTGSTFRKETGSNGVVSGSYGLAIADGRQRVVNYIADAAGFRADVKTNEPGVNPSDPANAAISKAAVIITPTIHYASPAAVVAASHPVGAFAYNSIVEHHGTWW